RQDIETLIDEKIREKEKSLTFYREKEAYIKKHDNGDELNKKNIHKAMIKESDNIREVEREIKLWESYRNIFAFRNHHVEFFDIRYFFPEVKDGFDITIGNPPYVRADEPSDWNRLQRSAIMESDIYETLWEKWDLFVPFIERAYKLLRPGGVSTMIVSDAFCHSKYAQKPQNWFLQNSRILRLDFCSDLKIFDAAVHNLIYFFQKDDGKQNKPERRLHKEEFGNITTLPTDEQAKLTYRAFFPGESKSKSDLVGTPIEDICYVSYGLRPNSDEDEAKGEFTTSDVVSDKKDKIHCKPYVEGKHLAPWLPATNQWIEWGTARAPERFCRPTFPELYAVPEKIIAQRSPGPDPVVSYDDANLIFTPASVGFVPWHMFSGVRNNSLKKAARYIDEKPLRPDLPQREELEKTSRRFSVKYLLAVMNSSVARDFLRANRRSNIHLYPDDWKKLPIPDVDAKFQKPVVSLVDKILTVRRANPNADIADLEKQVDDLVVALYDIVPSKTSPPNAPAKIDLKERLRTECLPELCGKVKYFHIRNVRAWLKERGLSCEDTTLKQYMSELMAGGFIHDAGKGWYSTIAAVFTLDAQPLQEITALLTGKFPLLRFDCWSTEQLRSYTHHTLNKFVTFVHVGKDAMRPVFETLRGAG
ncbi:MAG: DUF6577 family protein, partial [Lentisphaerota bacterium]